MRCIESGNIAGALFWIPGLPSASDIPWDDPRLLRALMREVWETARSVRRRRSPWRMRPRDTLGDAT